MLSPAYPESWRQIIVRAEVANCRGLDPLHNGIRSRRSAPVKALIARLRGGTGGTDSP